MVNREHAPLKDESLLVFPDILKMYSNVDTNEAIDIIGQNYEQKPSEFGIPKDSIVEALHICENCNCVRFNDRYYLPCRGCAMGPAHGCDLTDIWLGPFAQKYAETCPVERI